MPRVITEHSPIFTQKYFQALLGIKKTVKLCLYKIASSYMVTLLDCHQMATPYETLGPPASSLLQSETNTKTLHIGKSRAQGRKQEHPSVIFRK